MFAVLIAATAVASQQVSVSAPVTAAKPCTFTPNCDYGHGSRTMAPAKSKEECCTLCQAAAGCAAGVLSGDDCWFKSEADVAGGCQHSSKVDFACMNPNGPPPPPPPPSCSTPACIKLEKTYNDLKNNTCAKVAAKLPKVEAADLAAFMTLYQSFKGDAGNETVLVAAASKILDAADVNAFLAAPDSFGADGLDADMVKCALLVEATGLGLAEFAQAGQAEEDLVTKLLADTILMRDMMVAGGASSSMRDKGANTNGKQFGQAMQIYTNILKASPALVASLGSEGAADPFWDDRSNANILKRLALGTALEHAVPITLRYKDSECDEAYDWCPTPEGNPNITIVDPVGRFLHYEKAYKAGDLDPAFEVLTVAEIRRTTESPSTDEDLTWLRDTMAIYRPDAIARSYGWRFAEVVHEVSYGDPQCATMPGICDGHYSSIPAAGGVCGPRAFFTRFARNAWGLPVWGATQPGHAAMTTWSPSGWGVLLGAGWPFCWWGERSGPDFLLEMVAREQRASFQQVLRGQWAADALGEVPAGENWGREGGSAGYGQGGPWAALMWCAKKIEASKPAPPARVVAPSVVPTKVDAILARWPTPLPTPAATTAADGTITIPASSFSSKNRSASVSIMHSMDAGVQVLHGGCASSVGPPCLEPSSSSFEYTVTAPAAGTYYLTANITTWHPNQDLMISTNGAAKVTIVPTHYTVGWWNQTQPLEVELVKGSNTLSFTRFSTRELVFKEFTLYTTKPIVPKAPGNYTPVPPPPSPPPASYIETPAATNCVRQGIAPVPEEDCSRACLALGFTSTGDRARANISGCFVMTEGEYAGNCNFNTNKSATCDPPCTLMGSVVRSLCIRK